MLNDYPLDCASSTSPILSPDLLLLKQYYLTLMECLCDSDPIRTTKLTGKCFQRIFEDPKLWAALEELDRKAGMATTEG
ncbi:hypothetical protein RHGRI_031676 [Rhododendron griersonianum]|uniref:Uncharacterized protein n=1 Tax=Rhododendron griersonianum TaxID=479676 RepID=A0AAV6I8U5_9ERIC|nr:hypothetical protein RHGRI_031676 [Rhododendron griersonianum]